MRLGAALPFVSLVPCGEAVARVVGLFPFRHSGRVAPVPSLDPDGREVHAAGRGAAQPPLPYRIPRPKYLFLSH